MCTVDFFGVVVFFLMILFAVGHRGYFCKAANFSFQKGETESLGRILSHNLQIRLKWLVFLKIISQSLGVRHSLKYRFLKDESHSAT